MKCIIKNYFFYTFTSEFQASEMRASSGKIDPADKDRGEKSFQNSSQHAHRHNGSGLSAATEPNPMGICVQSKALVSSCFHSVICAD